MINNIEDNFNVDELVIEDTHIWPIIRYDIVSQLNSFLANKAKNNSGSQFSVFKKLYSIVMATVQQLWASCWDLKNNSRSYESDILYISNTINLVRHKDGYVNRFVDPLNKILARYNIKGIIRELQ